MLNLFPADLLFTLLTQLAQKEMIRLFDEAMILNTIDTEIWTYRRIL